MKKFTITLICILTLGMLSCAAIETSKICNSIPEGQTSVLCEISGKVGTTPEAVGAIVKVSTLLLMGDAFTAKQAYDFITDLEETAKQASQVQGITYDQLIDYAAGKYLGLPPKVQAAIVILKEFYNVQLDGGLPSVLSQYDWGIILTLLSEQKAAITPFI